MNPNISKARQEYLDRLSEEERKITIARWSEKARQTREENKAIKESNDIVGDRFRECLDLEYVTFEDGSSETILDRIITSALASTTLTGSTLKDLKTVQEIAKKDDKEVKGQMTINLITNGQDLGD